MFCSIYKTTKKDETYLFIPRKDDFSDLPDPLIQQFSPVIFVMTINLSARKKLAQADIDTVRTALTTIGYYVQIPPTQESLLTQESAL